MSITAYIALGGNLGDRQEYLTRALEALRQHPGITVTRVSSFYETIPVGGPPGQPNYLNGAAELHTDLEPRALLQALLAIEARLGRVRRESNGPRTVDLDLLLYGDRVLQEADLIVPHPRMHERTFVLQPLAEIAPDAVHPGLGATVAELLKRLPGQELTGLRAMVTGSTSGIGLAIAHKLAGAGARVLRHGRRPRAGAEPGLILADLRQPDECRRLVDTAWAQWNGLDIWINNAGADTLTGEAAHWPFERKLQELFEVDVRATMLLSRAVGQLMQEQGRGVIVNIGWDQAETGMEGDSGQLFATIKAGVMAFTKSLALSLAPEVRVNCLAPGWVRTAWGTSASAVWQERVQRETPLRRWGTPEDVAAAARWLVSPAAAFITGQVIRVNGGAVR
jgi:2-amino-4-hydroxy-6-hydroxymethyldihydropteridine diphosphokinase